MKTVQKLLAALLAVICLFSITACVRDGASTDPIMEDGEDVTVSYGKVTVANLSGKDAAELYYKRSDSAQWSKNILSVDVFHKNMGIEITYPIGAKSKYDIRLVFEDGTHQDFLKIDLEGEASKGRIVYLGNAPENAPEKTTVKK